MKRELGNTITIVDNIRIKDIRLMHYVFTMFDIEIRKILSLHVISEVNKGVTNNIKRDILSVSGVRPEITD